MFLAFKAEHSIATMYFIIATRTFNLKARLCDHFFSKYSNLYKDIKAYGLSAFKVEILDTCYDSVSAYYYERQYIKIYNSRTYGYNISKGGEGSRDVLQHYILSCKRKGVDPCIEHLYSHGNDSYKKGVYYNDINYYTYNRKCRDEYLDYFLSLGWDLGRF